MKRKEYLQLELPFDNPQYNENGEKEESIVTPLQKKGENVDMRQRAKRRRIRVTFGDGTVCCDVSATVTMIQAIEKIGVERVASLGMENCHIPLISKNFVEKYAEWTKEMSDGWYLMAQSDSDQKYRQLKHIITSLSVDATIELGDYEAITTKENVRKGDTRKHKSKIIVTLPNGMVICGDNPLHTFRQVINHITIEKVEKTNLKIGGNPITTPIKRYNNQVQLSANKWLTVPSTVKNKCKILRIISALTCTPFEVKIVE